MRERLRRLGLYGLLAQGDEIVSKAWLPRLIELEEAERQRRSRERRLQGARIGAFKPMADFDWQWPKKLDRELIDELFTFSFVEEAANVVLLGPNGVGKSMIAKSLAHAPSSPLLPALAAPDDVGHLSYDTRDADLLFEVTTSRYQQRSIVLMTNKPFGEWNEVFPNAACVVTLVDRLVHRAEIISIVGHSYRLKQAEERAAQKAKTRASRRGSRKSAGASIPW